MRFQFLGAAGGHVTGSCTHFLYTRTSTHFLVDCGMMQGERNADGLNSGVFKFYPPEINFVLLTHAHLDHCGLIPKLYKEGFRGEVICTKATADLAKISLTDSVKYVNGLFTEEDIKGIRFRTVDDESSFGPSQSISIHQDLWATFTRSAHILGAASITISWLDDADNKVYTMMSGDIGGNTKDNPFQPLLAGCHGIFGFPSEIIVESTYGNRTREPFFLNTQERLKKLSEVIKNEVYENKRLVVIPAFSLHRTQEILFDLHQVFNNNFSSDVDCQTNLYPKEFLKPLEENNWDGHINSIIEKETPRDQLDNIKNAIEEISSNSNRFHFCESTDANKYIPYLLDLISKRRCIYPVTIVLDSPLARKISAVYGDELCRRQQFGQNETLYRNRNMMNRLGLTSEDEVDHHIKTIFPHDASGDKLIPLGIHGKIHYKKGFVTPRSKDLIDAGCIIITGAGMCEGGPVLTHFENISSKNLRASVLITGYMAKGTLGHQLQELCSTRREGQFEDKCFNVGEKKVTLKNIIDIRGYYSGHADRDGLVDYIFKIAGRPKGEILKNPTTVFINHGSNDARVGLKDAIKKRTDLQRPEDRVIGTVELPDESDRWYDLNTKQWLDTEPESKTDALMRALFHEQRTTNMLLRQLIDAHKVHANNGNPKRK